MAQRRKRGRPRLYRNTERMSLHVPASLLRRIERRAKGDRRSLNATTIELIEKGLDQ
ncbi:hypothetical protein LCGC14_1018450 [marine sediment metagenome]|uniref:Arc-like DNA binding domain-containing protein n=1 Tax=marine sediment metagenome TaxID=412755 RepID=A0A0F9R437_9ZZZZ